MTEPLFFDTDCLSLLRMISEELVVIVPHKAHSAGTMICLESIG